jgi:hypothetical protein
MIVLEKPKPFTQGWGLHGNSGLDSTAYLGTSDNKDFRLGSNGNSQMVIKSNGNIGMGTNNPQSKLDIHGGLSVDSLKISSLSDSLSGFAFVSNSGKVQKSNSLTFVTYHDTTQSTPLDSTMIQNYIMSGKGRNINESNGIRYLRTTNPLYSNYRNKLVNGAEFMLTPGVDGGCGSVEWRELKMSDDITIGTTTFPFPFDAIRLCDDKKVAIGEIYPTAKLQVHTAADDRTASLRITRDLMTNNFYFRPTKNSQGSELLVLSALPNDAPNPSGLANLEAENNLCFHSNGNVSIGTYSVYNSARLSILGNQYVNGNIIATGNVGIGTSSPTAKLTVNDGNIEIRKNSNVLRFTASNPGAEIGSLGGEITFWYSGVGYNKIIAGSGLFKGNVVIGDGLLPHSVHSDALLIVSGKAVFKDRLLVTIDGWADYVFDKKYKLMTFDELSIYIKRNHSLPDIPSEKEILEKGVDVGEMNKLLLKKVEELTLYILELEKRVKNIEGKGK